MGRTFNWSTCFAMLLVATGCEMKLGQSVPPFFPYLCVQLGLDRVWVNLIDGEGKFNARLGLHVVHKAMGKAVLECRCTRVG